LLTSLYLCERVRVGGKTTFSGKDTSIPGQKKGKGVESFGSTTSKGGRSGCGCRGIGGPMVGEKTARNVSSERLKRGGKAMGLRNQVNRRNKGVLPLADRTTKEVKGVCGWKESGTTDRGRDGGQGHEVWIRGRPAYNNFSTTWG